MKDSEIRNKFRDYFEKAGHKWYSSLPLVPPDDPTMLFTTAGMVQFKKNFLGESSDKVTRAASIQKCLRTSDIDEVGKTSRHLTFFEMYGNFSFGDYFKEEAIEWGWKFLTEELELPEEKLYATIYKDDDEAFEIWKKYVPENRIVRLGEKDNFWTMGETGPCGPCSEILYDRGPEAGCDDPGCSVGCECDRYLEVWNLVFTQFDRQADGSMKDLPRKNIDTGMGLERLDQVLSGVNSVYDTPVLKPIMDSIRNECADFDISSARIVADHIRAATFLIADGISPSNEGRGYVLRRLIRRAAREARKLGWAEPVLWKFTSKAVDVFADHYPELEARASHIASVCKMEEEGFLSTLDAAVRILDSYVAEMEEDKMKTMPAEMAFKLYDTYGLPIDITRNILQEKGLGVDDDGFSQLLEERAKSTQWTEKESAVSYWDDIKELPQTHSVAHDEYSCDAKILKILDSGKAVVLDKTVFYAESGGQVGDSGIIKGGKGKFIVDNTISQNGIVIHTGSMDGALEDGEDVIAAVDISTRKATERNHSATHILQSVLREMLGDHVQQNGSLVEPDRLRFDFTHTEALSRQQINDIEKRVNSIILSNIALETRVMRHDEAIGEGALAFFGDKYGDEVRTVSIKDPDSGENISMELCGGTHLDNTSEVGQFKIISESGIAAGVRRIEAVTGLSSLKKFQEQENLTMEIAEKLKAPVDMTLSKIDKLQKDIKDKDKKINQLEDKLIMGIAKSAGPDGLNRKTDNADFSVFAPADVKVNALRNFCDNYTKKDKKIGIALTKTDNRVSVVVKISKDLTEKYDARELLRNIAVLIDGSGGGRVDMAQGGGTSEKDLGIIAQEIFEAGTEYITN